MPENRREVISLADRQATFSEVISFAGCEINAILQAIDAVEAEGRIPFDLWRGLRLRLHGLASVTMCTSPADDLEFMLDTFYGQGHWVDGGNAEGGAACTA